MPKRTIIELSALTILLTHSILARQPSVVPTVTTSPAPTTAPTPVPSSTPVEAFITPQMVTAIGGLWLVALIIVLGVLVLVFHKQLNRLFNIILIKLESASQFNVTAGPVGASVTTIAQEAVKETLIEPVKNEEVIADAGAATVKPVEAENIERIESKTSDDRASSLIEAMKANDREEVERIYHRMQDAEISAVQKLKNEALYLWVIFELGDPTAINKLVELAEKEESGSNAYWWLALCYEAINELEKAANAYINAAERQLDVRGRVKYLVGAAKNLVELGERDNAYKLLLKEIEVLTDSEALSYVYGSLAFLYSSANETELKALALIKALEYTPNNTKYLFDAAYSLGEVKLHGLSVFHYKTLLQFGSEDASALNNIGVEYGNLQMPIHSIEAYKAASKLKNSLAEINLAYGYLNSGFIEEASEIIKRVKEGEDVPSNIGAALSSLSNRQEEENKKRDKIIHAAMQQQKFLRSYAGAYFHLNNDRYHFNGKWSLEDGTIIQIIDLESFIWAEWDVQGKKFKLSGSTINRTAKIETYKMTYEWFSNKEKGYEKDGEGYAYISEDQRQIYIISIKNNENTFLTLTKISEDKASIDEKREDTNEP